MKAFLHEVAVTVTSCLVLLVIVFGLIYLTGGFL